MKSVKLASIIMFAIFVSSPFVSSWINAVTYDIVNPDVTPSATDDSVTLRIPNPGNVNISYLENYTYHADVRKDKTFVWKVTSLEKTSNFHVAEGDKKIKKGDKIKVKIAAPPDKDIAGIDDWALIYVNDVAAGYSTTNEHIFAFWKYILPAAVNITEDGYFYQVIDIYDKLGDIEGWSLSGNPSYNVTITDGGNVTYLSMVYDRSTGLLNELHLEAKYSINGRFAGANMTLIRLHGWGLPYYTSTMVVWIPLMTFFVLLIIALRLKLFQKLKLYFEARKLAKRE